MKQLTPEEAKKRIQEALRKGNVTFANPKAASISLRGEKEKGFTYVEASVIPARKTKAKSKQQWNHEGGIHFQWGKQGLGFGEASLVLRNSRWEADTETLGVQFLKDLLCAWVDRAQTK